MGLAPAKLEPGGAASVARLYNRRMAVTTPNVPPTEPVPVHDAPEDEQHLRILSVFYYVISGLGGLGACVGMFYGVIGIVMTAGPDAMASNGSPPPAAIGWFLAGLGVFIVLMSAGFSVLDFLVGRFIARRTHRTFCLVVAGITCLSIPIGTILGVFTMVVLMRPSVRAMFQAPDEAPSGV